MEKRKSRLEYQLSEANLSEGWWFWMGHDEPFWSVFCRGQPFGSVFEMRIWNWIPTECQGDVVCPSHQPTMWGSFYILHHPVLGEYNLSKFHQPYFGMVLLWLAQLSNKSHHLITCARPKASWKKHRGRIRGYRRRIRCCGPTAPWTEMVYIQLHGNVDIGKTMRYYEKPWGFAGSRFADKNTFSEMNVHLPAFWGGFSSGCQGLDWAFLRKGSFQSLVTLVNLILDSSWTKKMNIQENHRNHLELHTHMHNA